MSIANTLSIPIFLNVVASALYSTNHEYAQGIINAGVENSAMDTATAIKCGFKKMAAKVSIASEENNMIRANGEKTMNRGYAR